jgi:AP endonuclease-1
MPKIRVSVAPPSVPVRESPRKRKRDEQTIEAKEVSPPSKKRGKRVSRSTELGSEIDGESVHEKTLVTSANGTKKTEIDNAPVTVSSKRKSTKDVKLEVAQETYLEDSKDGITVKEEVNIDGLKDKTQKPTRKRKTKEEKEAEAMPLAARTTGLKMYVGAHVSIAKGVENAIKRFTYWRQCICLVSQKSEEMGKSRIEGRKQGCFS